MCYIGVSAEGQVEDQEPINNLPAIAPAEIPVREVLPQDTM